MQLKKVTKTETKIALSILKESAEWLQEIGSDQWSDILQGEDKHGLAEAVERGEVFFFYNNKNQLAGMVAAWKNPTAWDKLLWQEYDPKQFAYYLHRVIIRPNYRGSGYGKELLTELKLKFKTEVSELRLDCLARNQKLIQFYLGNEFVNIGSASDLYGNEFELFSYKL
ncbi:GNAT family N-acetyltransferase [Enterococcus ureilyticus]|uniref:GNAT family N-acetyltransferase n=1 Tax=Enterococcus ureilyticus TaxID=1131292 RepID=A0A1E5HFC7_9ENTE|nr:GNAT family N-acetyltransferase [Enterococcus ureilyticus]MBM7689368.1 ribosomal protein S18 acetylase RimI-like enzyme [Enterococcus ureilyticus]MBO0446559.1 GNAT family N-acetyltransferase [Enterococcus ureilyticus]OEG23633.1 GNAT family N-acetyltransferase [Enterococcus ureilyticus]